MSKDGERLARLETDIKYMRNEFAELKQLIKEEVAVSMSHKDFIPYKKMIYALYGVLGALIIVAIPFLLEYIF